MIVAALAYLGLAVNDLYLMFNDGIWGFSDHTMAGLFILAGFIVANLVVDRRMRRWRQPESEFDQQLETWDRIG